MQQLKMDIDTESSSDSDISAVVAAVTAVSTTATTALTTPQQQQGSSSQQQQQPPLTTPVGDQSHIRPQIIVTPRKVAAAIESVTAAVLAKNNKTSLADCVPSAAATATTNDTNLLRTSFAVFDLNSGASTSSSSADGSNVSNLIAQNNTNATAAAAAAAAAGSPSKSVIVRAGPSVRFFILLNPHFIRLK